MIHGPNRQNLLCTDKGGYEWQEGARVTGESIVMERNQK